MDKTSIAFISAGMVSGTSCLTVGALAVSGKISLAAFGMTSTLLGPIGIAVGILLLLISAWSLLKGLPNPASTDVQGNKTVVAASDASNSEEPDSLDRTATDRIDEQKLSDLCLAFDRLPLSPPHVYNDEPDADFDACVLANTGAETAQQS